MKYSALVLSLFIVFVNSKIPDMVPIVWGQIISPFKDGCIEESKVNTDDVNNMIKNVYVPNDPTFHAYLKCIYLRTGMLLNNGTFNTIYILTAATYMTPQKLNKCVDLSKNESNLDKKSYIFGNCVVLSLDQKIGIVDIF